MVPCLDGVLAVVRKIIDSSPPIQGYITASPSFPRIPRTATGFGVVHRTSASILDKSQQEKAQGLSVCVQCIGGVRLHICIHVKGTLYTVSFFLTPDYHPLQHVATHTEVRKSVAKEDDQAKRKTNAAFVGPPNQATNHTSIRRSLRSRIR
jgi:hypothetical protein